MILKYKQFIKEAYLSGSKQPLYHFTRNLTKILETDLLKRSIPTEETHGYDKSISLTRNVDYSDLLTWFYLELDTDKLFNDGIKSYPVDESGWTSVSHKVSDNKTQKSNFDSVKSGLRGTKHNLNLPNVREVMLETEFEERIYKDIPNLGKYIISIGINNNFISEDFIIKYNTLFNNYLEKYPQIKIFEFDNKNHRSKKDITYKFKEEISKQKVTLE